MKGEAAVSAMLAVVANLLVILAVLAGAFGSSPFNERVSTAVLWFLMPTLLSLVGLRAARERPPGAWRLVFTALGTLFTGFLLIWTVGVLVLPSALLLLMAAIFAFDARPKPVRIEIGPKRG